MELFRSPHVRRLVLVAGEMIAALAVTTLAVGVLEGRLSVPNASATYLLAVVAMAVASGIPAAVGTAIGAFLLYDFVFVQPTGALVVADPEEWLNLMLLLVLGVIVGQLAGMQRARAQAALLRERQARAQYRIGRALATSSTAAAALPDVVTILQSETGATRAWIALGTEAAPERVVADSDAEGHPAVGTSHNRLRRAPGEQPPEWVRVHDPRMATPGGGDPRAECYRVPIVAGDAPRGSVWVVRPRALGRLGTGDTRVLAAAADQVGQALERDRLAQEATSAEIARRSEAAKTALLDSVSHDLRTPLASIRVAAGSLMDPALDHDPAARQERAAVIDREADRLNRLVSNLLDMSRIDAGDLRARLEPFPLEDLVDTTLGRLTDLLEGHPLTVAMPADLAPVEVDPVFIDQVLSNLLENAARHSPPGAPIRVHAAEATEATVRLTVEDGGPGVAPESLGLLFQKFSRVPRAGEGSRRGSGIGLAVVRGLVEAMGGRVGARASELGGLAIDVDLRAAAPPMPGDAVVTGDAVVPATPIAGEP
jgi:two-component system sensor histidine kinase KdpD